MNNKYCLAAVSLAAMSAALPVKAQSSVTLYGIVDDALTYSSNQGGHSNTYLRQGNLSGERFGMKGHEDLSSTMSAIFVLEQGFDVNTGAQGSAGLAFNRQAFVGVQDKTWGTVTAGRQYTPYYLYVGPLSPSGWLTGATGAHPGDYDGLDTTIRINSSITYETPTFDGFKLSAMYGVGGIAGQTQKGSSLSAAARYDGGPLSAAVGYLKIYNTGLTAGFDPAATGSFSTSPVNTGYRSAYAVQHIAAATNYTIGPWMIGLNYSNVRYAPGQNSIFHDTAVLNTGGLVLAYKPTPLIGLAGGYSYTRASAANGIHDSAKYHQFSLEETYQLSKRTTLYALQAYQHALGNTLAAGGAGHIVAAVAAVGDSQSSTPSSDGTAFVGMVGIRHAF
jgi:predicted porin